MAVSDIRSEHSRERMINISFQIEYTNTTINYKVTYKRKPRLYSQID